MSDIVLEINRFISDVFPDLDLRNYLNYFISNSLSSIRTPVPCTLLSNPMCTINFCVLAEINISMFQESILAITTIDQINIAIDQNVQDTFGNNILHLIAAREGADKVIWLLERVFF